MCGSMDTLTARAPDSIIRHDAEGFDGMRKAGQLAASCLDMLVAEVKPGADSARLDDLAYQFIRDHGAVSATVGYRGFGHALCISPNHVICHGIPGGKPVNAKPMKDGDILNIDITVVLDGWHGDTSRMYWAGEPKVLARRLTDVTYECLWAGIDQVKPGNTLYDIGKAIQDRAEADGFTTVHDFCGHGLGKRFHQAPNVVHYGEIRDAAGRAHRAPATVLEPGMFFTIEPMICAGKPDMRVLRDGWTAVTRDRSLTAQFEHAVAVTEDGVEVFTRSPAGYDRPPYAG